MTTTATDMSPTPTPAASTAAGFTRRWSLRRLSGLVGAEMTMLLRNRVAVFYAVAMAPFMVLALAQMPSVEAMATAMPKGGLASMLTVMLAVTGLSLSIYYNLTTAVVARRESLSLKRLRTGESTTAEILTAVATPNLAIFLLQVLLVLAAVSAAFGAPGFTNPLLFLLGLLLGAVFFALASFITGVSTRNVEAAQLTTMPGILVFLAASGLLLPLQVLPDPLATALRLLPVAPVTELLTLGLGGTDLDKQVHSFAGTWRAAARPVAVMVFWIALSAWHLGRTMAWEPRR